MSQVYKFAPMVTLTVGVFIMISEPFSVALFREFDKRGYKYNVIDTGQKIYQVVASDVKFLLVAHCSTTYHDSGLGAYIAQRKNLTNKFLKDNNYPHTKQVVVDQPHLLDASLDEMEYPLVLKPLDQDNGRGVFCNIAAKEELLFYLQSNFQFYNKGFILEKHETGQDYRITIIGNKFAFAIKRTPPIITGDGVSSIKKLIEAKNKIITKKSIDNQVLKTIPVDVELQFILKNNNFSLESVLKKNETLQLKNTSNLSTGGERELLNEKDIHPEVISMCESLSNELNLFAIGIDYMSRDIAKKPQVNEDVIIEINHNPQLGASWAPLFVDRLLKKTLLS